jgi:hypothetical protein
MVSMILIYINYSKHRWDNGCEHKFYPFYDEIFSLLKHQGYERVFKELSKFDNDNLLLMAVLNRLLPV